MFEQRDRRRISFQTKVTIKTDEQEIFIDACTRDISIKGVYARTEISFPVSTFVNVEVVLVAENTDLVMRINGQVVRRDDEGFAVQFDHDLIWWPLFKMYEQYDKGAAK